MEEDLTATPDTFFGPQTGFLPQLSKRYTGGAREWNGLYSKEIFALSGEASRLGKHQAGLGLQSDALPTVHFRNERGKGDGTKDGGTHKAGGATRRVLRQTDVTDPELLQKYQDVEERLRTNSLETTALRQSTIQQLQDGKQERSFTRYQAIQQHWQRQQKQASAQLGRPLAESVITRAEGYREKVENITALEMATPSDVKYGAQNWYISLRSSSFGKEPKNYTLHTGNNYTGLWMHVTDNPHKQCEVVRKPKATNNRYKTFKDNPFYKEKVLRESKRLREIIPLVTESVDVFQVPLSCFG